MDDGTPAGGVRARISGGVSGQVAIGSDIRQQYVVGGASVVTPEERRQLLAAVDELATQMVALVPDSQKEDARENARELKEAVIAEKPNLRSLEYVRTWVVRHLPQLAGSVTSLVLHPILGKLVEAAGTALAEEFRLRFGRSPAA
jgi:hypothetical protein